MIEGTVTPKPVVPETTSPAIITYHIATFQQGRNGRYSYSEFKSIKVTSIFGDKDGLAPLMNGSEWDSSQSKDERKKENTLKKSMWFHNNFNEVNAKKWLADGNPRRAVIACDTGADSNGVYIREETMKLITMEQYETILAS